VTEFDHRCGAPRLEQILKRPQSLMRQATRAAGVVIVSQMTGEPNGGVDDSA
jgi:hypothetical protein